MADDGRISRVTLLEDRAQVQRVLRAELLPGHQRLSISGVTSLVHDRSLRCTVSGEAKVLDVRATRRWVLEHEQQDSEARDIYQAEERVAKDRAAWDRAQATAERELELIGQAIELSVEGICRELGHLHALPDTLTKTMPDAFERQRKAQQALWLAERGLEECDAQSAALAARRAVLSQPRQVLSCAIDIDVEAAAADVATLTVEYMVPCAAWRPMHRARLAKDAVTFSCDAAVWQATGEAWTDVTLQFSTARSTQRAEPPVLQDDLVRQRDKQQKAVIAQLRAQRIQTTGEGMAVADELPGVDDGGEARLLVASMKATVDANGRLHRVAVFTFEAPAVVERTSRPELSELVHMLSRQKNLASAPLLAGPVELVRDSGAVGTGSIAFTAPGETFTLGWGSDDGLRVKRQSEETRETARLTGKQTIARRVTLFLSNLDAEPATFLLQERIPVSELQQVSISIDTEQTKPLRPADENGIVRWDVRLAPLATDSIVLRYTLIASSDVQGL